MQEESGAPPLADIADILRRIHASAWGERPRSPKVVRGRTTYEE
jgi:hypothetical protein